LLARGIGVVADRLVPRLCSPASLARDPGLASRLAQIVARQDAAAAAAQVIGMKERVGSEDLLEDITVPTLIIAGERDALIPLAALEQTAAALADVELVALADCGHMPMLEAPLATTAALERFVARCAVSAAAGPSRAARA